MNQALVKLLSYNRVLYGLQIAELFYFCTCVDEKLVLGMLLVHTFFHFCMEKIKQKP